MSTATPYLVFGVNERRYALDVDAVERIVLAAETTPLPDAPDAVLGLINIAGEIMPVLDMRRHLGFSPQDMELTDRFIITHVKGYPLALLVEATEGVLTLASHVIENPALANSKATVSTTAGSIVLVQDIMDFASIAELGATINDDV